MTIDGAALLRAVRAQGTVVRVLVAEIDGSAPREAGASMTVWETGFDGTIGGGALEWEALRRARDLLDAPGGAWARTVETKPLGPALGQCCGGVVRLLFERLDLDGARRMAALAAIGPVARPARAGAPPTPLEDAPRAVLKAALALGPSSARRVKKAEDGVDWIVEAGPPEKPRVYLYGAGHIGRALARVLPELDVALHWVDDAPERFPSGAAERAEIHLTAQPESVAAAAPAGAIHLIMTYSHDADLAIAHALLARNDHRAVGLIGSETKRARFLSRLRAAGVTEPAIARLTCPIGVVGVASKTPGAIALATAAQVAGWIERPSVADATDGRGRAASGLDSVAADPG